MTLWCNAFVHQFHVIVISNLVDISDLKTIIVINQILCGFASLLTLLI